MKQAAMVSSHQFGFIYLGGIPYNPVKVKRFVSKGAGIKIKDLVIFEADEDRVLSYIKNALYIDSVEEKRIVKEFVRAAELDRARMSEFAGVSDDIRKQLAEEGIVIHGDKVELCPAIEDVEVSEMEYNPEIDFDPEVMKLLLPDQKRTLSIMLQSSLKIATDMEITSSDDVVIINDVLKTAKQITEWVDRNSTGILPSVYIKKVIKCGSMRLW